MKSDMEAQIKDRTGAISSHLAVIQCEQHLHLKNTSKMHDSKCLWRNRSLECYGGLINTSSIKPNQLNRTRHITFCGWQNEQFNLSILHQFTELRTFHIKYGQLSCFVDNFPALNHLKVKDRLKTVRKIF